ncbi:MAG: Rep family protein, partial [Lactococcus lactis]|nr:Rep family protein [Lactococcus lactis]NFW96324.1 replication protein [Staphylococcus aureus]
MAKKKDTRTRNWTFFVYPESAPSNWREILDSYHVPWIESPLHDKDVNSDGEIKKAHWHVLLMFSSK